MEVGFWRTLFREDSDAVPLKQRIPEVALFRGGVLEACYASNQRGLLQKRPIEEATPKALLDRLLGLAAKQFNQDDIRAGAPVAIRRLRAAVDGTGAQPPPPAVQLLSASDVINLLEHNASELFSAADGEEWSLQSVVPPAEDLRVLAVYSRDEPGEEQLDVLGRRYKALYWPAAQASADGCEESTTMPAPVPDVGVVAVEAKTLALVRYAQEFHGCHIESLIVEFVLDTANRVVLHGFWKVTVFGADARPVPLEILRANTLSAHSFQAAEASKGDAPQKERPSSATTTASTQMVSMVASGSTMDTRYSESTCISRPTSATTSACDTTKASWPVSAAPSVDPTPRAASPVLGPSGASCGAPRMHSPPSHTASLQILEDDGDGDDDIDEAIERLQAQRSDPDRSRRSRPTNSVERPVPRGRGAGPASAQFAAQGPEANPRRPAGTQVRVRPRSALARLGGSDAQKTSSPASIGGVQQACQAPSGQAGSTAAVAPSGQGPTRRRPSSARSVSSQPRGSSAGAQGRSSTSSAPQPLRPELPQQSVRQPTQPTQSAHPPPPSQQSSTQRPQPQPQAPPPTQPPQLQPPQKPGNSRPIVGRNLLADRGLGSSPSPVPLPPQRVTATADAVYPHSQTGSAPSVTPGSATQATKAKPPSGSGLAAARRQTPTSSPAAAVPAPPAPARVDAQAQSPPKKVVYSNQVLSRHQLSRQVRSRLMSTFVRQLERYRDMLPVWIGQQRLIQIVVARSERERLLRGAEMDRLVGIRRRADEDFARQRDALLSGGAAEQRKAAAKADATKEDLHRSIALERETAPVIRCEESKNKCLRESLDKTVQQLNKQQAVEAEREVRERLADASLEAAAEGADAGSAKRRQRRAEKQRIAADVGAVREEIARMMDELRVQRTYSRRLEEFVQRISSCGAKCTLDPSRRREASALLHAAQQLRAQGVEEDMEVSASEWSSLVGTAMVDGIDADALVDQIMRAADRMDHNGYLTMTELQAFLGTGTYEGERFGVFLDWLMSNQARRFRRWDRNQDGAISAPELRQAVIAFLSEGRNAATLLRG